MVENRRQWSIHQEGGSRAEASLREQPHRTDVQHDPAAQREDNQLDDDKRGYLDYKQLLANGIPHGPTRTSHAADGKNVEVDGEKEADSFWRLDLNTSVM